MSSGFSKSILKILPVLRASISTLLATWAATKSAAIEKASCTGSTLKMGSWPIALSLKSPEAANPPPFIVDSAMFGSSWVVGSLHSHNAGSVVFLSLLLLMLNLEASWKRFWEL